MSTKHKTVLITLFAWLAGTSVYAYMMLSAAFASRSGGGYENDPYFILIGSIVGFLLYQGIYFFGGLILIIWVELMLFETVFKKR